MIEIVNVTNEGVQSASHDPTSYSSPICLSSVLCGAGEQKLVHDASLTQISAPLECYQLCSQHPEQMNLINQLSLALNWVDPPAPQEQPWHSCKFKFCDCPLLGTPDLYSLMVEASSLSQQDSSLPTVDDLSMQAPVHSGTAATLHGSGPTCDLPVGHSEVAGGSKVDLLSVSGGTLSTLEELSLLRPSLVLGRLDPLKVKHNSRFITKKKSPYKYQIYFLLQLIFLGF